MADFVTIKTGRPVSNGVEVTTADGDKVEGIRAIDVRMRIDDVVTAEIELMPQSLDVQANAEYTTTFNGKRYRLVEI